MVRLKKVGVLSAAKTAAMVYGALGLIIAPFFLLGGLTMMSVMPSNQRFLGVIYVVLAIAAPFLYAAMGFIGGAFVAWFYNLISRKFDAGLELELEQLPTTPVYSSSATA
ncbi:MAG: hypothetical protein ABI383_07350 [Acidobacteriaceae bacterium]